MTCGNRDRRWIDPDQEDCARLRRYIGQRYVGQPLSDDILCFQKSFDVTQPLFYVLRLQRIGDSVTTDEIKKLPLTQC